MKTIKRIEVRHEFVELIPDELEECKIYISKKYSSAIHNCLCGCGNKTVMPLNHGSFTDGWDLMEENNGTITFRPSVGNFNFPCKSHYIITKSIANVI